MKRLLRISLNTAIFSLIPILSWFALGIIVDKNLTNVFTLTYPLQFIWLICRSLFGTGANICKEKDKEEDAVLSGMTLGTIIGFFIFGFVAINIKRYPFYHLRSNLIITEQIATFTDIFYNYEVIISSIVVLFNKWSSPSQNKKPPEWVVKVM